MTWCVRNRWSSATPILLVSGDAGDLKQQLRLAYQPLLVLDDADMQAVRGGASSGELLDRLALQLDLSLLALYERVAVTGSRFFGREFEVRRILQTEDSNFAIMGHPAHRQDLPGCARSSGSSRSRHRMRTTRTR